jgi:hypothetical protein
MVTFQLLLSRAETATRRVASGNGGSALKQRPILKQRPRRKFAQAFLKKKMNFARDKKRGSCYYQSLRVYMSH